MQKLHELRRQFEPMLLGGMRGFVATAQECARAWDRVEQENWDLPRQVEIATEWLLLCKKTKNPRPPHSPSSYGLKHEAQGWGRRARGYHHEPSGGYVSNGALLMAAIMLGFTIKRDKDLSFPNAWLNISSKRPDGYIRDRCGRHDPSYTPALPT
jgi:hypothetical protein